ncbi:MAG: hypothetical protein AB7I38_04050 [Dehalococcoidia bacterium]
MMLRPTAKALKLLGVNRAGLADRPHDDDDWYLDFLWIEQRKCLLLTHAGTLFSIFTIDVRLPQIRPIGGWALSTIRDALAEEGLPEDCLGTLDATQVSLGRATDRRTLAFMERSRPGGTPRSRMGRWARALRPGWPEPSPSTSPPQPW